MEHSPVHSPFLPIHKAWRVLSSSSTCERFLEGSLGFRSFLTSLEISSGFSTVSVMDSSSLYWSESLISSLFLLREVLFLVKVSIADFIVEIMSFIEDGDCC